MAENGKPLLLWSWTTADPVAGRMPASATGHEPAESVEIQPRSSGHPALSGSSPFVKHPSQANLEALHGHNPEKLLFLSFDKNAPPVTQKDGAIWRDYQPEFEKSDIASMGGNPTIKYLNSAREGVHDPGVIIRTVKEHVKTYGTLSELLIDGHGYTNRIGASAPLDTRQFLRDIKKLQNDLGVKVAERIEFGGCDVFDALLQNDVAFYKDMAQSLGAEIVGATNPTSYSGGDKSLMLGRFWEFTPKGKVERSHLGSIPAFFSDNNVDPALIAKAMQTEINSQQELSRNEAWLASELHPNPTPVNKTHYPMRKSAPE